ncbi:MAG TPA: ABC transporter permease [Vicinamibacterales bacterium]|nr:ABC transporter permease [Vicinamibacterales bacterium]
MNVIWRLASRLYACSLLAFPTHHRVEYRAEMLDSFARDVADRRQRLGAWQTLRYAVAASLNAVSAGLGERRRGRSRSTGGGFSGAAIGPDLIHAIRSLRKAKAFTFVSVVSLGIGMGTVIALIVLLRVLIGPALLVNTKDFVELLVIPQGELRDKLGDWATEKWSYPDFADVRDSQPPMTVAGWSLESAVLGLPTGESRRVATLYGSPTYFKTVGVSLARGREFEPADDSRPVVIVSHYLWQASLNGDPDIVGKSLMVDGVSRVVVGLTPDGYRRHLSSEEMTTVQLYVPLSQHPRLIGPERLQFNREIDWVRVIGRLSPGTNISQANTAISAVMAGIAARYPATNALKLASVEPYNPMGAKAASVVVLVRSAFLGISGTVLLVVCLNISGLVMVRSARRERELAVRLAMGASRARLIQSLLTEALVLAVLGGGLASMVLFAVPPLVTWLNGTPFPDPRLRPDALMALISVGLCFVTSLIFGLVPAIRFSRPALVTTLKDEAGGGGRRVGRTHRITTAIQAGIAVPFLVICGVKLDNVRTTATAELGFKTQGLYALPVDVSAVPSLVSVRQHLESAPRVTGVTIADGLPLDFRAREIRVARDGDSAAGWAHLTRVDPNYIETMEIKLLSGRSITTQDRRGGTLVAVLSQPLALRLFPDGNALGQRVSLSLDNNAPQSLTVVGVTADVVASQMGSARPQLWVPLAQHPSPQVIVIARASTSLESAESIFQQALPELDHNVLKAGLITGDRLIKDSMWDLFTHSAAAGACAAIALVLTALGVFGVVGFMVATRTREIGVRIALGASRLRVLGMIMKDTVKLVVPGVLVGFLPAAWFIREDAYYSLGLTEPLVYASAAAITVGAALLSALPSARRAAKVEPIIAMKSD